MNVTRRMTSQESYEKNFTQLGRRLFDKYEVFGVKEGGFGRVYFMSHIDDGSEFAVKVSNSNAPDPTGRDEFQAELALWFSLLGGPMGGAVTSR